MEVYAHRGSSLDHPENTLAAFEAAIADGATGVETDLRLTRDGRIVLAHDADLRRVAGDGRRISALPLSELRSIRLENGLAVPTLEELWTLAAQRVHLNLEIKDTRVAAPLASFLRGRHQGVLVTSSHFKALDQLRSALPQLEVGPVLDHLGPKIRARLAGRGYRAVSLSVAGYSDEALAFCREAGLRLLLWVVNDAEQVLDFARRGVAGIFTDCPRPMVQALRST